MSGVLTGALGVPSGIVDISDGGGADDVAAGAAFARIAFDSDGDIISEISTGAIDAGDWITPKAGAPGAYEIMAHQDSGSALDGTSSALDTWLALSSIRDWEITQVGAGLKTAALTISIRLGSTVLSSGSFSLSAQAS